jgi:hypothetical protein
MESFDRVCWVLSSVSVLTACHSSDPSAAESDAAAAESDAAATDADTDAPAPDSQAGELRNKCAQETRLGGFEVVVLADCSSGQGAGRGSSDAIRPAANYPTRSGWSDSSGSPGSITERAWCRQLWWTP